VFEPNVIAGTTTAAPARQGLGEAGFAADGTGGARSLSCSESRALTC
jgi:hypothetical protein